jgi:hypothetical protein
MGQMIKNLPYFYSRMEECKLKNKSVIAVFLAVIMLLGVVPFHIMAIEPATENAATVYFMGEETTIELGSDGFYHIDVDVIDGIDTASLGEQTDFSLPPYVYIDGERVPITSDRILNGWWWRPHRRVERLRNNHNSR